METKSEVQDRRTKKKNATVLLQAEKQECQCIHFQINKSYRKNHM